MMMRARGLCPISLDEMESPVQCPCKEEGKKSPVQHFFDRKNLLEWLQHKKNCPITRLPIDVQKVLKRVSPVEDEECTCCTLIMQCFQRTVVFVPPPVEGGIMWLQPYTFLPIQPGFSYPGIA